MAKPIELLELTSPGCIHCAAFKKFWHEIEKDWPNVYFKEISLVTSEGQELVQKYQIV